MKAQIHVLVVDDSAVVRQAMMGILTRDSQFRVSLAPDAVFALRRIAEDPPDVIVLDLEMPRMSGLAFLDRLMSERPIPVVVCSACSGSSPDVALDALEAGAVEVIQKPVLGVGAFLSESALRIVEAVRGAAGAARPTAGPARAPVRFSPAGRRAPIEVIAIGASTGGTEALGLVIPSLPDTIAPTLVVQHMPAGFTHAFAHRLNAVSRVSVREARTGERVSRGEVVIAPGDRHLRVRIDGGKVIAVVDDGPLESRHRPSVNVLFTSVAEAAQGAAVGAIFTGMGDDGALGLLRMRQAGAVTLAQDEQSCIVYGMPREAVRVGAVSETVALSRMSAALAYYGTPRPIAEAATPGSAGRHAAGSGSRRIR